MDKLEGRDLVSTYKVGKKVNEIIDLMEEKGMFEEEKKVKYPE